MSSYSCSDLKDGGYAAERAAVGNSARALEGIINLVRAAGVSVVRCGKPVQLTSALITLASLLSEIRPSAADLPCKQRLGVPGTHRRNQE